MAEHKAQSLEMFLFWLAMFYSGSRSWSPQDLIKALSGLSFSLTLRMKRE